MTDARCPDGGHETAMHRCWRLTCPRNGGSEKLLGIVSNLEIRKVRPSELRYTEHQERMDRLL